jgi:hypothetical protein
LNHPANRPRAYSPSHLPRTNPRPRNDESRSVSRAASMDFSMVLPPYRIQISGLTHTRELCSNAGRAWARWTHASPAALSSCNQVVCVKVVIANLVLHNTRELASLARVISRTSQSATLVQESRWNLVAHVFLLWQERFATTASGTERNTIVRLLTRVRVERILVVPLRLVPLQRPARESQREPLHATT